MLDFTRKSLMKLFNLNEDHHFFNGGELQVPFDSK